MTGRLRTLAVSLLLALSRLAAAPALAEEPLAGLLFRDETADSFLRAPVLGSVLDVRVTGIVARATVTQIFTNPTDRWLEAVYVFPLPDEAAVDRLRMVVGERVIEGRIAERKAAAAAYAQARDEGRKASLLEQDVADLFTTSVANVGPGERVEVEIEMQFLARYEAGSFRLTFPLVAAPRYGPTVPGVAPEAGAAEPHAVPGDTGDNPLGLRLELDAGFPLERLASPSHAIVVRPETATRFAVTLAEGVVAADRDFVLEWQPVAGREPQAAVYVEEVAGERFALLLVVPPAPAETPLLRREVIFVLDTSGSMAGMSLEQAKAAITAGLRGLNPEDRFNVIRFSDTPQALHPAPVDADPAAIERAVAWVGDLETNGGTEIGKALEAALTQQGPILDALRQVVFMSDGLVGSERQLFQFISAHLGEARLFPASIGATPNRFFLRKAAQIGRGSFTEISSPTEVEAQMARLLAQLSSPALGELAIAGGVPGESYPEPLPDLYLGEPVVAAVRLPAGSEGLSLSGLGPLGSWATAVDLRATEVRPSSGVARLWARFAIESRRDQLALGADAGEIHRQILEIALRYGLVSEETSLVAEDREISAPVHATERNDPGAMDDGSSSPLQECITVTSESPLIDERRITSAASVSSSETDRLPTARSPWSALAQAPAVRVAPGGEPGGSLGARVPAFAGPGSTTAEAVWNVDGVEVPRSSASGLSPGFYWTFDSFEEVWTRLGGADSSVATPGVRLDLVTRRATNQARASAAIAGGDDGLPGSAGNSEGDRLRREQSAEVEGGGALPQDRLWLHGAVHQAASERAPLGDGSHTADALAASVRLDAQPDDNSSINLYVLGGDSRQNGAGADPRRAVETTAREDDTSRLGKLEATRILNANLYLTLRLDGREDRFTSVPRGGRDGALGIDAAGIARGGGFGQEAQTSDRGLGGEGKGYLDTGSAAHEVSFGGRIGRGEDEWTLSAPGRGLVVRAGEGFGLDGSRAVVERWQGGVAGTRSSRLAVWFQDQIQVRRLTLTAGGRFDREDDEPRSGGGSLGLRSLVPRLGLTWAADGDRQTLLRATLARFRSWDGVRLAASRSAGAPRATLWRFLDADGDLALDAGEEASLEPWPGPGLAQQSLAPWGLPWHVQAEIDPEIAPETIDEAVLAIEHQLTPELAVELRGTYRRRSGLVEERLAVRDPTTGEERVATAADWRPAGILSGSLPEGGSYAVPYFDLAPEVAPTGSRVVTNGDREQETRSLSLVLRKRMSRRLQAYGHLTWTESRWILGPEARRTSDPTPGLGDGRGGVADGDAVVESLDDVPFGTRQVLGSGWSFLLSGRVELPGDLSLAATLNGRQGEPLPYFRRVDRPVAGPTEVRLTESPDAERAARRLSLDLRLDRPFTIGELVLTPSFEVFNALGDRTVLRRELDLGLLRGGQADEKAAGRTLRFGLRAAWR